MAVVKKYKVCTTKYRTVVSDASEKRAYQNRIGTIVEFDDGRIKLELDMWPNLEIEVIEIK